MIEKMSPVFYDIEASALNGFPIEIGWAQVNEIGHVVSESYLIRPVSSWDLKGNWDDNAEKLHGISKKLLLKNGIAVDEVAARMNNALRNRELFSDSGFDEAWLQQIFDETALTPSFIVRRTSCEVIIRNRATQLGTSGKSLRKLQHEASQLSPIRHRAEADACYWATIWKLIGS